MNEERSSIVTKVYFGVAVFFLFCAALLWSVDPSFIYLCLGAAVFFLSLAVVRIDWKIFSQKEYAFEEEADNRAPDFGSVLEGIIFYIKRKQGEQQYANPSKSNSLLFVFLFFVAAFVIFSLLIFSGFDNGSNAEVEFSTVGDQYYYDGQYDSAYLYYRRALNMNDKNEEAFNGLGNVMLSRNNFDSALYYYTQAATFNPLYTQAFYNRSVVFYTKKDYAKAIEEADKIISKDADYSDAYLIAGDSYYLQEKYDLALPYYETAYNKGMRSKELCNIMAFIYDTNGDTKKAIALYKETLSYDSVDANVIQRLGELLPGDEGALYRNKSVQQ
jgi:tetratricopeptide (TPR) repeat protein